MAKSENDNALDPPAFMQLTGHPLRWRLLLELGRSDRMVYELTELIGEPQNLVSYHLGKLRKAHLVSARRSAADRRDAYYTLDLARIGDLLSVTGRALHPGLNLIPPAPADVKPSTSTRVLFLCTGNSARSQMAEGLARSRSGGLIDAHSAGSNPKPLHPNAVRVMHDEYGIDLSGQRSKHLSHFTEERFDRVVSLCDRVREACPQFPGQPEIVHWSIPDPAAESGDNQTTYPTFRQTAADLETRIRFMIAGLTRPTDEQPEEE